MEIGTYLAIGTWVVAELLMLIASTITTCTRDTTTRG